MNKAVACACTAAFSAFFLSSPAMADNTGKCLQLYYMKSYTKAAPFCTLSAKKGNSHSQYVLGLMYSGGLGVKKNKTEAIHWLRAASKQAYAAAHYKLVKLENEADSPNNVMSKFLKKQRHNSTSGTIQKQKTTSLVQQSAVATSSMSESKASNVMQGDESTMAQKRQVPMQTQYVTGKQTKSPIITAPPFKHTKKLVTHAAPPTDDSTLYRQHLAAAKRGDANARFMLGLFYLEGRGIAPNTSRATGQFKLAAKQGQAQAQFSLGLLYYDGRGNVMQNKKMAEFWFTKAAMQGLADAQYSLGLIYANGINGNKNESEAIRWWHKAAAQKHAKSQHNLAVSYLKGTGVRANRKRAMQWFIAEAEHGDPQAQSNLGKLYSEGEWLDQSGMNAATWFYRAGETWLNMKQPDKARHAVENIRELANTRHLTVPNLFLADVLTRKINESTVLY